jgi:hypothetical protein
MLVARLDVLKASIKRPVGISNVRIMESRDVVTSHLESGENVYQPPYQKRNRDTSWMRTYNVEDPSTKSTQLPDYPSRFHINNSDDHVVAHNCQESAISMKQQ